MTVVAAVVVLGLVVALGLAIAWPVLTGDTAEAEGREAVAEGADEARRVQDELDRSLQAIKEIAFDRASGHLSEEDFRALDADERARAVELIRRRDALTGGDGPGSAP